MSTSAAQRLSPSFPHPAPRGAAGALRAWQQAALDAYCLRQPRDFLAVATPGAGKTTFALRLAGDLLGRRQVQAVTVVTPTEHLKRQWADAADRVGIALDPSYANGQGPVAARFQGVALTYAQVAAHPLLHRNRTEGRKTLVILDEVHHGGDALSWGEAIREAFDPAARRLALTGTPFRSDVNAIPFVSYAPGPDGVPRSVADHAYGYADALRDGVVRPVVFLSYSGQMRWRTRAGDEVAARLGEPMTRDLAAQAWRTALDPAGEWMPAVLSAADRRLTQVRRGMPDAGGLVIASDQDDARAYAALLRSVSGEKPTVVLSDEPGASQRIERFAASGDRWLVAVRMVSEGVDIPRLAVGVYATSTATPLFFAQAVGRFVRARRRGETASVFLPSVPRLLEYAAELEVERDHVLGRPDGEGGMWSEEEALLAAANRAQDGPDALVDEAAFQALESAAEFDRVLFDGGEFGRQAAVGSADEEDFLGLPGLLEPDQVAALLRQRQADQLTARRGRERAGGREERAAHREVAELRKELSSLVAAYRYASGRGHAAIHADLRRATGGPPAAQADAAEIARRIETLRRWAVGRR